MASLVPIIPTVGVSPKPANPKPTQSAGLAMAYPMNEGAGLPKDITGHLNPLAAPVGASWVPTPWGMGYSLDKNRLTLGVLNVPPPITYHVLFKPSYFPAGSPVQESIIFGEVDAGGNILNGVAFDWGSAADTCFASGAYNGQTFQGFTPVQPIDHSWYSVSYTYDGASSYLYLNGSLVAGPITPNAPTGVTKTWVMGSPVFSGVIADARVYNRALSSSEIPDLISGPRMWVDYGAVIQKSNHQWRRHPWQTGRGTVFVARRVARIWRR